MSPPTLAPDEAPPLQPIQLKLDLRKPLDPETERLRIPIDVAHDSGMMSPAIPR